MFCIEYCNSWHKICYILDDMMIDCEYRKDRNYMQKRWKLKIKLVHVTTHNRDKLTNRSYDYEKRNVNKVLA